MKRPPPDDASRCLTWALVTHAMGEMTDAELAGYRSWASGGERPDAETRRLVRRERGRARTLAAAIFAENPDCHYCGAPATVLDHVVPIARGGTSDRSNLVPACWNCNTMKGMESADDYHQQLWAGLHAMARTILAERGPA